jgi:hypothetical protein
VPPDRTASDPGGLTISATRVNPTTWRRPVVDWCRRPPGSGRAIGGQHTELIAIGIGHHHPADLALADVDSSRPERDETVDLRLLITVSRWSEVEMQPVLPGLRLQWRTAPRDLRTAARRADRGLLVLVPDQRPAQRCAPEVSDVVRTVARKRSDESAVSKEVVARLDDAELIAFGSASTT